MRQPELMALYDDQKLNAFTIKNGKLIPPSMKKGWWEATWNSIGETWDDICDTVTEEWEESGLEDIVLADAGEATVGAIEGAMIGKQGGARATTIGAIMGGLASGARGSISEGVQQWGK